MNAIPKCTHHSLGLENTYLFIVGNGGANRTFGGGNRSEEEQSREDGEEGLHFLSLLYLSLFMRPPTSSECVFAFAQDAIRSGKSKTRPENRKRFTSDASENRKDRGEAIQGAYYLLHANHLLTTLFSIAGFDFYFVMTVSSR